MVKKISIFLILIIAAYAGFIFGTLSASAPGPNGTTIYYQISK